MTYIKSTKRLLSIFLIAVLLFCSIPLAVTANDDSSYYNRAVDESTMDNWTKYFDLDNLNTANAGGIWSDKSVFTDASAFPEAVQMIDDEKNFLTALSAIAANKEVVGYSTVPTDTIFILDLSNSMSADAVTDLIDATNSAIATLQNTNLNNRVGVVLYAGQNSYRQYDNAVKRLLPIDRYTTAADGKYIVYENGYVSADSDTAGTKPGATFNSLKHGGSTYIQAGLWEAYRMFTEVPDSDIVIGDDNWQSGEARMPIVVLMTDGAPTLGATKFDDVINQTYNNSYGANVGDGDYPGIRAGQGFLVQLTASYIKNKIEAKYKVHDENGAGRSLFYTLGFNIDDITNADAKSNAISVLDPSASDFTDSLWATYKDTSSDTMSFNVRLPDNSNGNVSITKNPLATGEDYVTKYFKASGNQLNAAFVDIVSEILLQSRYYPTQVENGNPDFSGYLDFVDELGEYMEVKHINGILLGDVLFDGHMMASKLVDAGNDGLGTPDNPTALGDEFIGSVKTRLEIDSTDDARALVTDAWNSKQLYYNVNADQSITWSNYIGWYADSHGAFIKHWDENPQAEIPDNAVYTMKSYGFLGETKGSIKNSDMMYMTVQVRHNIQTGKESVVWRIPAALIPMITYLVTLEGKHVDSATNVNITVEDADNISPIRLIYETGLSSRYNPYNISEITGASINDEQIDDKRHLADDNVTRLFWNNAYDITAKTHDEHKTATAEFTPNRENERFYFTFDSAVHKKVGENTFAVVGENEELDVNGEYYHRRYIFRDDAPDSKPVFFYEKMSSASIGIAKANGWQANFETLDHQTTGAWVVPKGTPARELTMYDEEKDVNKTKSAHMVFHPYLIEDNNTFHVDMNLGNNGLLAVTPATGIKITKTVSGYENGTANSFKFRLTADAVGRYDAYITTSDETPNGDPQKIEFVEGVFEFSLSADQTLWVIGLAPDTHYTVEELSGDDDYKIKSVHLNGKETTPCVNGTVAPYVIDDVDFVNTLDTHDSPLEITATKNLDGKRLNAGYFEFILKRVTPNAPMPYGENGDTYSTSNDVNGTISFGTINYREKGVYVYEISETDLRDYRYDCDKSVYTVTVTVDYDEFGALASSYSVTKDGDEAAEIVFNNKFTPETIIYDINEDFDAEKILLGRDLVDGEFEFALTDSEGNQIGDTVTNGADGKISFPALTLNTQGTHQFKIVEKVTDQKGVTFDDTVYHLRLEVVMDDAGTLSVTDKKLYLASAEETAQNAIVFTNNYKAEPTELVISGTKDLVGRDLSNEEFSFELYDADGNKLETVKNRQNGTFAFEPISIDAEGEYIFTVREVKGEDKTITYDHAEYTVKSVVVDNLDGTFDVKTVITKGDEEVEEIAFVNTYTAPAKPPVTPPVTDNPKTGEAANLGMWFALLFVSGGIGTTALAVWKKTDEK